MAAATIQAKASPRDVVVLSAPFTIYPFDYYYGGSARVHTLPDWNREKPGPIPAFDAKTLPQQVASLNKNHQYAYVLLSYNQGYEDQIYQYYQRHFEHTSTQRLSPDLRLEVYRVGYDQVKPLGPIAP